MSPSCFRRRQHVPRTHTSATAITAGFKLPSLTFIKRLLDWRPVDLVKPSRLGLLAGVALLGALSASPAFATDPSHVTFTLEGCRNDGSITLPIDGKFVCPAGAYTTGNLGKGWNELDLVPYRLTADAGTSAPDTQTYTVAVVVDNEDAGKPGYDVLSGLTLNTAKSKGSCPAPTVTPDFPADASIVTGFGGIDQSIYRLVKITQAKGTTCVYDYWARLALGSHLFPGSALHANLASEELNTAGIGARDVSIPVKEITPQELDKTMSARQDADHIWNLTKKAEQPEARFGNVCATDAPTQKDVKITITWEKLAATKGATTVVTNIIATNPASRDLQVTVCDSIFKGPTPLVDPEKQTGALNTKCFDPIIVKAGKSSDPLKHEATLTGDVGNIGDYLNDVATGTYTDVAFPDQTIPGNTFGFAQAKIALGNEGNSTAEITDTESISGTGLAFSVATPSVGGFTNGYSAGTKVPTNFANPVNWSSGTVTDSGSVTFVKTIYLDPLTVTSGTLTDTASLLASDGFKPQDVSAKVDIDSSALATLNIEKVINTDALAILGDGEKYLIKFTITRSGDAFYKVVKELTFIKGDTTTKSITPPLENLTPDTYFVHEEPLFVDKDGNTSSNVLKEENSNPDRTVNLNVTDGKANCTGSAKFTNVIAFAPANAQVAKVTDPVLLAGDPDFTWTFTLTGGNLPPAGIQVTADAGGAPVLFGGAASQLDEGAYTVTETLKGGWDQSGVKLDDGVFENVTICTFTVNYPQDTNKTFSCTFKNTKRGEAQVIKTFKTLPITGSEVFQFDVRQGASSTADGTTVQTLFANAANGGTITFTKLIPGDYQLCEVGVLPGWKTTLTSDPTVFYPPNGGDNSTICVSFTVKAGDSLTDDLAFKVDNTPPPEGKARTIGFWKNWASCKQSNGKQAPVLDQTLAKSEPTGVTVGNLLTLHGDVSNPDVAPSCKDAVNLLNKSTLSGTKKASDPLFNMAAQLVAAELNYVAGAGQCKAATDAIAAANKLLSDKHFNGFTHDPLTKAEASLANSLATTLDLYNNNKLCP